MFVLKEIIFWICREIEKNRGNSEEFIKRREREFSSLVYLFEECENALKIIIKKGQYLSDALEENNIIKKKKEYIKFKK